MTASRLTFLAMAAGAAAAVLLVVAAQGEGSGDSNADNWVLGLLVILAPLLCAAVTRSVASSTLVRPVGGIATFLCALASAVHVAVAVKGQGPVGWLYGAPAIATPLLLLAAVIRGPGRGREETADAGHADQASLVGTRDVAEGVDGPPLDVITPLLEARDHATKSALAWLVVLAILAVVAVPLFRLLGWPTVAARLDARVAEVREVAGGTAVTFQARDRDRTVVWSHVWEDPDWEVGDRKVAFLDEDGDVHLDQQFGLAGIPLLMPFLLAGMFSAFAIRRAWGVAVAWWDVHNDQDRPRLGYAAVIDDPAPRTWRPLLAVWEHDPTSQPRLAKPDAVYRADDETGQDLQTPASRPVVRRAWIDTGMWDRSKPRWVGFQDGVAVPHRRSFLGRWYIRQVTRRAEVAPAVALHHGPPGPRVEALQPHRQQPQHRIAGMIAWRLVALVAGVALAFLYMDKGQPARIEPSLTLPDARPAIAGPSPAQSCGPDPGATASGDASNVNARLAFRRRPGRSGTADGRALIRHRVAEYPPAGGEHGPETPRGAVLAFWTTITVVRSWRSGQPSPGVSCCSRPTSLRRCGSAWSAGLCSPWVCRRSLWCPIVTRGRPTVPSRRPP